MFLKECSIFFVFFILISFNSCAEEVRVINFSESRLKALNIDLSVAEYFSKGAKFTPGIHEVDLFVNGVDKGNIKALFDRKGELCIDQNFFIYADISLKNLFNRSESCSKLEDYFSSSSVVLHPNLNEVNIFVPPSVLINNKDNIENGGVAALVNYSAYSSYFSNERYSSQYKYLNLESGINLKNWMLRFANSLTKSENEKVSLNNLYAYAQKTFIEIGKTLQFGQINTPGNILSGLSINGVQLIPQTALIDNDSGIEITAIASESQSRVDIYQNGALIYSTMVPAGVFLLNDISVLNISNDIEVHVIAPSGNEDVYILSPSEYLRRLSLKSAGYSLSFGKLRNFSSESDNQNKDPFLLSASDGWNISRNISLDTATILSDGYKSIGIGLVTSPYPTTFFSLSNAFSYDQKNNYKGFKQNAQISQKLPFKVNLNAGITTYSSDYRELIDSVYDSNENYVKTNKNLGMSWSNKTMGSFSFSASRNY